MPTTKTRPDTFEICLGEDHDTGETTMLVYRSIHGGICGPFSANVPCADRETAERIAFGMGFLASGDWQTHRNGDSCPATHIA